MVATLRLATGDADLAQAVGTTKIDISGVNTGARAELTVVVERTT